MDNLLYISIDGDGIGSQVGRAVLSDDEASLKEVSGRIAAANDYMAHAIQHLGGEVIEMGGDEITAKIPPQALEQVEAMRQDVATAYGFTLTIGVGSSLSEAAKSLLVGKTSGKNKIVQYSPEVDSQIKGVADRLSMGEASEEDQKISDAYLTPKEEKMKPGSESHEHTGDDCEYCAAAEQGEFDHDHSGDDCEYCQDAGPSEVGQDGQEYDHDHSEENCEYCQNAGQGQEQGPEGLEQDQGLAQDALVPPAEEDAGLPPVSEQPAEEPVQDEHTEEGMKQIARDIENEEGGQDLTSLDDTEMPIGDQMEDGVSRPDDYNETSDHSMGLSEEEADDDGPDLGSVLKDGLDSHADNIQKEKVSQMVGQALEGFKANKKVLELAQKQAPEFYQASIAMLKAMIEMAKMLGMNGQSEPGGEAEPDAEAEAEAGPEQEAQEAEAPQGQEGQPPPKKPGQLARA